MVRKEINIAVVIVVILVIGVILFNFYHDGKNGQGEEEIILYNQIGLANPASGYCSALGYNSRINQTESGQQGICIFPDGSECDRWLFYAGLCGQEWSYCELKGYDIETRSDGEDPYAGTYGVCIDKNTKEDIGLVSELINTEFD